MRAVSKARAILLGLAVIAIAGVAAVFGNAFATRAYLDQTATRGETTLRLAVSALRGHMSRFEPLPAPSSRALAIDYRAQATARRLRFPFR